MPASSKKGSGGGSRKSAQQGSKKASSSTAETPPANAATSSSSPTKKIKRSDVTETQQLLQDWVILGIAFYCVYVVGKSAYRIRMRAIDDYGPVIHEFDPYFNYRATEYLYWNGARRFFSWFDYMSWYPLGRPVGSTIYPGMQFQAVWIKRYLLPDWSLNDVCCYIPAWFGVVATSATGALAYECSVPQNTHSNVIRFLLDVVAGKKTNYQKESAAALATTGNHQLPFGLWSPALTCGVVAMAYMSIVPAHLMRSMGGGYDNESVAVSAMILTFYCWVRSLRSGDRIGSPIFAIFAASCYFDMVAAWGGYVFVINMIGVHAAVLVLTGRFDTQVYIAYSLFYAIGTALAVQIPVVGWTPLKSLEQLGPAAVFLGYQLLQYCEIVRHRQRLDRQEAWLLRFRVVGAAVAVAVLLILCLAPSGYFGPISARVRGLFVQHTRTGNPLVDSVAEHQPANSRAYFQYLHHVCTFAPLGYFAVMFKLSDASSFLLVWATAAYFFSHKMVRLILLTAPIGSILAGIVCGRALNWCARQWWQGDAAPATGDGSNGTTNGSEVVSPGKKRKNRKGGASSGAGVGSSFDGLTSLQEAVNNAFSTREGAYIKQTVAMCVLVASWLVGTSFSAYCWRLSQDLSNPTIIQRGRLSNGEVVQVDDYREGYWWLRDNTPKDARVMAWWDYGYQIAGIANRTTIADGNTWNHEHIALLGKALTSDLDEGYEIARHWADYVLIWAGGGGDDLAKSPHLARIANSVYRDHCPDDPTCRAFGFIDQKGTPSAMMRRSLLYRLHKYQAQEGVDVPKDKFQEVYRSKYSKIRIYKVMGISEESKAWVADPANLQCDVPGSWFCPGQYPPGLSKIVQRKKDFSQLEDFNRGEADEEYQRKYFEHMKDPEMARRKAIERERALRREEQEAEQQKTPEDKEKSEKAKHIDEIYRTFEDTEDTTYMWKLISSNSVEELTKWLEDEPHKAFIRSKDGRGPMWWAFEQRNEKITKLFMKAGVPHTDRDLKGMTPVDLLEGGK